MHLNTSMLNSSRYTSKTIPPPPGINFFTCIGCKYYGTTDILPTTPPSRGRANVQLPTKERVKAILKAKRAVGRKLQLACTSHTSFLAHVSCTV